MTDYISQQLGNYRLIKHLGRGGFADVYLGEHVHLKTRAAVKVLHAVLNNDDIDTFRTEALTVAHLVHPHIIRVLDFDVVNGVPFLVMDYAPNGNLRERHPKGTRVPPDAILFYVQQVASALQYAHDRNLMHRDVKPENMLVGNDNEILLSDFGTALTTHSTLSQNTENTVIGTLSYMSPEQIGGKPRPASDQYALAVVTYEWLSGKKPFSGSHVEIAAQHLSAPPPSLNDPALGIPPAVQQVMQRAMAKDYHQRFPRVQDFATALQRAYQGQQLVLPTSPEPTVLAPTVPANTPNTPYTPYRPQFATPNTPRQQAEAHSRPPVATPARPSTPTPQVQVAKPVETSPITSFHEPVRKITRGLKRGVRVLAATVVVGILLLCILTYSTFRFFTTRNSTPEPTSTNTAGATALATDFMQAISQRNYDQAYNDLGPPVANQTSRTQFKQQAQKEDACYGAASRYTVATNAQGNPPKYSYTISRAKMQKSYQLNLTLQQNSAGSWQITDYQSNIDTVQPSCP